MLTAGTKLGPYVIEAPVGAGGMGEVYRAKDTRLDRTVAVKVISTQIADNADLRQRFDREAKAISSLNHPNICTLYDVGHQDGIDYLVMEYLDGETLASLVTRGPLPTADLLAVAMQIADALDKAHRQGMVHRDLKPGNIMLTKSGAKLMDFGLAKLEQTGGVIKGVSGVTRTTPLTGEGKIVGTLQYMSPEQLEGREADVRSDIFSFGAIMYEMTTGKRAFEGKSQASLIAAILKESPRSITALQPMSPPVLERVVMSCLAKDAEDRWQSAGDVKRALQWISEGGSQAGIPIAVRTRRKVRGRLLWAAVIALAAITTILGIMHFSQSTPTPKVARFSITLGGELSLMTWPHLSPDGSMIAFIASDTANHSGIYVRPLNSLDAHLLVKIQSLASRPFWSPDSKQLAFFENGQLKKVSVAGGLAQLICQAATGSDGSWGSKGIILFDGGSTDSIRQVPAAGGVPTAATRIDRANHEFMNAWPWFLPDGEHFLYLAMLDTSTAESVLKVGSIHSSETVTVTKVNSLAEYSNGYLLYLKNNLLVAQPFDHKKLQLRGEPVPLSGQVSAVAAGRALFSVSDDGVMVYQRGQSIGLRDIVWTDRHGDSISRVGSSGEYLDFTISPDGSRIAYGLATEQQNSADIWVRDLKRDVASRLTFGPGFNIWPVWSPDGAKVLFASDRGGGRFRVMQRSSNGTGIDESVLKSDSAEFAATDISRDGNTLILEVSKNSVDIWRVTLPDGKVEPLLTQPYNEHRGMLSPDGRFLAYQSDESTQPEIYIRELSRTGGKWQVSTAQGRCPKWRADGRELYYFTPGYDFMAVPISYEHGLEIGAPAKLFNRRLFYSGFQSLTPYAPSADGQRFLLLTPAEADAEAAFIVVQNWAEELKK